MAVLARQTYGCPAGSYYRHGSCYYGNDRWSNYGRWILLAAIIIGAFFIFFMFACITARRRRHRNLTPYRGTGWAAGGAPAGHGPAQYTGGAQPYYNQQQQHNPAPPYSPSNQGYSGNQGNQGNQGYFGGGQQNGVELQQPQSTYQPQAGGDPVYAPPAGPPPGKHNDGIIR